VIDHIVEKIYPIPVLAPEYGVHRLTMAGWCIHGLQGVKCDSLKVGGRRYMSKEALDRFFRALTALANGETLPLQGPSMSTHRTRREMARADREANDKLAEMGA
jgi:hypothetical protein